MLVVLVPLHRAEPTPCPAGGAAGSV